jgi:hypothetical protein
MGADSKSVVRGALIALALACSALLTCGALAAQAQEPDSVTFATAQPLELTWPQLLTGKRVEVCNAGRTRISKPVVVPTDFNFVRYGKAVPTPASVIAVKAPHQIAAGACASLLVRAVHGAGEAPVEPSEYKGTLLLIAAGAGSARLQTTITAPEGKQPVPAGVAEPVTLSIHNSTPFSRGADAVLLLKLPASGELAIGKGCSDASVNNAKACGFIGNLYQGGHVITIDIRGEAVANPGQHVEELPIRLHAFGHAVGAYEGTVTLASAGGSEQAIKVKVNAKDAWGCAVLALLFGVLLALVPQYWNGRIRPKRELVERNDKLPSLYRAPVVENARITVSQDKLQEYTEAVGLAIESYAKSVLLLDPKSKAHEAIDTALKLAEDDARVFSNADGLTQSLSRLKQEIAATTAVLATKEVADTPEILKGAAVLLATSELGVGEATVHAKRCEELLPTLKAWRATAVRVLTYVVWLKAVSDKMTRNTSTVEAETIAHAAAELWGLREALFEAIDAGDVAHIASSSASASAFGGITYLARKRKVPMPGADQRPKDVAGDLVKIGYWPPKGSTVTKDEILKNPAPFKAAPAKPPKLSAPGRTMLAGDFLVLAMTVAIGIVAGLSLFYFGKSFGTLEDYLTVIVVGTAAQVALKAILGQLEILLHDSSPDRPAVAAKLVVQSTPKSAPAVIGS